MDGFNGLKFLGDLTIARTYAKTLPSGLKENWGEVTNRYLDMMKNKYPSVIHEIDFFGGLIHNKQIVPSMRLMQFSDVIDRDNIRGFNCAFRYADTIDVFSDLVYLSACGCGVGISVMRRHTSKLPIVPKGMEGEVFIIPDNKEGWGDSFIKLFNNHKVEFKYHEIRPQGSSLSTGGTASGPDPLKRAHEEARSILARNEGKKLEPIDVMDIICGILTAIVSGGVRRSAGIVIGDVDDEFFINSKLGEWYKTNPTRCMVNISAMIFRDDLDVEEQIKKIVMLGTSGFGEPAYILHNGKSSEVDADNIKGVNPCGEITLANKRLCNLTEIIAPNCNHKEDFFTASAFIQAAKVAAFFGTLQAGITNFHYLSKGWEENAIKEPLIGVSITGIAMCNFLTPQLLEKAASAVVETNKKVSAKIGILSSPRCCTLKPSGSTSSALGTTSGVAAAWSNYYIRRISTSKDSPLGKYIIKNFNNAGWWCDYIYSADEKGECSQICIEVPCSMKGAITQEEGVISLLERMKMLKIHWINKGKVRDSIYEKEEHNNVSITAVFEPYEKEKMLDFLLENKHTYRGVALLPRVNGYDQPPYQEITEEEYKERVLKMPLLDVTKIVYSDASRKELSACSGGSCEVSF